MGVKGLFQFLKQYEKQVNPIKYCRGKNVAIDTFWFLHQSKGNVQKIEKLLLPIINTAKQVYCVFDGRPPQEKREQLQQQAQKRREILDTIERIEHFMKNPFQRLSNSDRYHIQNYVEQLKRQAWSPTPDYVNSIKKWLQLQGAIVIQAEEEADDALVNLELYGTVDLIITNDSDLLVLGSSHLMRLYNVNEAGLYDTKYILKNLRFTELMWHDFMYLSKHMDTQDVQLAYSLVSVYKDIDYALQKYSLSNKNEIILSL
jgi:5'-3' exonuclease